MRRAFVFCSDQKPATRGLHERKLICFLKRLDTDTEAFAKLTKKNLQHVEGRIISLLSEDRANQKGSALLANQSIGIKRGKSGLKQENQIYNTVFQNQCKQKGGHHNVHRCCKG
jgi:hypothetical protein